MVIAGNKDDSIKCFELAQTHFEDGNREKALRFAQKAERLFPSQDYRDFISLLNKLEGTSSHTQCNGVPGGGGGGGTSAHDSKNESDSQENVRHRRTASPSGKQDISQSADYTTEQQEAVKRIKKCKDYYEILGISKDSGDTELKKAYRKLALQFHPDKNKAPGAAEAFKAVGNAYAVLSDVEKRKQYDLYGPEEAPSNTTRSYDYTRGYESDVTAEELFNMFFGGGYPGGTVYTRRNGRWERAGRPFGHSRAGHHHHHESSHGEQSNLSVFLQLMPLLLILMLSLLSSLLTSDPYYSLSPTSKYNIQKSTRNLGVNYFVKPDFGTEYQGSIRRLEQQVEEDYVATLRNACYKERNYKENMIWRAKSFGDAHLYRKAQDLRTPSCDTLHSLYS